MKLEAKKAELIELSTKVHDGTITPEEKTKFTNLCEEVEILSAGSKVSALPTNGGGVTSWGKAFVESEGYQTARKTLQLGKSTNIEPIALESKTLLTNSGAATDSPRTNFVQGSAQRQPSLIDVFNVVSVSSPSYVYLEETTYTNAAAGVSEGLSKPESGLGFTERTVNMRKVACNLPVTTELLADMSNAQSTINDRLTLMVRQKIEDQIFNGDDAAPNWGGLLGITGTTSHTFGSDSIMDAVAKMITKVSTTGRANANAIFMHPTAFESVLLAKNANDDYFSKGPFSSMTPTLWGLPVYTSTVIPSDKLIVCDTSMIALGLREDVVLSSGTNSDDFVKNRVTLLCEARGNVICYRPASVVICDMVP